MCTQQRLITNIYTHKEFYVPCGHCSACLQEKAAHRVRRIKDTFESSLECMMVSLTYSRFTAPYIKRDEAYAFSRGKLTSLNVYRDCKFRKVRQSSDYVMGYKKYSTPDSVLTVIPYQSQTSFSHCKDMKYEHDRIGVCYYPDVQHFVARLRLNLKRLYSYDKFFKTYCCSEYGSKSHRPHFHILLFYRKGDFEILRNAIIASWSFSDLSKFPRAIEKCFRGASYVASYVNSGSDFPPFLEKYFKPKHSYSKGFGLGNSQFSLSSILSLFERGSLTYGMLRDKQGIPTITDVSIPAYVIHRYFPKFKAYSRISPSSMVSVMRRIADFDYDKTRQLLNREGVGLFYYSLEEFNRISVLLNNAYKRFLDNCPDAYKSYTMRDYFFLHKKIWSLHASTCLKLHLLNKEIPDNEKYDNLDSILYKREHGLYVHPFFERMQIAATNPNEFSSIRSRSFRFSQSFHENIKHRRVNNEIMSIQNDEW